MLNKRHIFVYSSDTGSRRAISIRDRISHSYIHQAFTFVNLNDSVTPPLIDMSVSLMRHETLCGKTLNMQHAQHDLFYSEKKTAAGSLPPLRIATLRRSQRVLSLATLQLMQPRSHCTLHHNTQQPYHSPFPIHPALASPHHSQATTPTYCAVIGLAPHIISIVSLETLIATACLQLSSPPALSWLQQQPCQVLPKR
jgi:hypothetical protein